MAELTLKQGEKGIEIVGPVQWTMKSGAGYSPVESLVAAVGACGAYVYQDILKNSQILYTFHEVAISYERNTEKQAQPLKTITLDFVVSVAPDLQKRAERGLKLVSRYCPVIQSLDPQIVVTERVVFREETQA